MDVIELNPPSDSQQAQAGSDTESEGALSRSVPPTPSLPPPDYESKSACESGGTGLQRQPPCKCGKYIYYLCEKCQNMSLNRMAYNKHVKNCHGHDNAPRSQSVVNVRAQFFEKAPILVTCVCCEIYTQVRGPIMDCHEYICGERHVRNEIGDPPYVPPLKMWYTTREFKIPPASYARLLQEFARGGPWEVEEKRYLENQKLEHLSPLIDSDVPELISLPVQRVNTPPLEGNLASVIYPDDKVAIVKPVRTSARQRFRERMTDREPNPCFSTYMGAVYDVKHRRIAGHIVIVGEPIFGEIVLRPINENDEILRMRYKHYMSKPSVYDPRSVAATIALHNVKTGRVVSFLECRTPPRQWAREYTILTDVDRHPGRCPGISVVYSEIPTELLKLFSVDQLSPTGPQKRGASN